MPADASGAGEFSIVFLGSGVMLMLRQKLTLL